MHLRDVLGSRKPGHLCCTFPAWGQVAQTILGKQGQPWREAEKEGNWDLRFPSLCRV